LLDGSDIKIDVCVKINNLNIATPNVAVVTDNKAIHIIDAVLMPASAIADRNVLYFPNQDSKVGKMLIYRFSPPFETNGRLNAGTCLQTNL
jgi:hypothetical protein